MAPKMSKNQDDSAILSSSSAHSPYNLRRNLSQPGGITKRNSSLRSKKNFHNVNGRISNSNTSSSTSHLAFNRSRSSSSDDEAAIDDNDANDIEFSDDEPEATFVAKKVQRKHKKSTSAKSYFDHVDENNYLCRLCLKVRTCSNIKLILHDIFAMLFVSHTIFVSDRRS